MLEMFEIWDQYPTFPWCDNPTWILSFSKASFSLYALWKMCELLRNLPLHPSSFHFLCFFFSPCKLGCHSDTESESTFCLKSVVNCYLIWLFFSPHSYTILCTFQICWFHTDHLTPHRMYSVCMRSLQFSRSYSGSVVTFWTIIHLGLVVDFCLISWFDISM